MKLDKPNSPNKAARRSFLKKSIKVTAGIAIVVAGGTVWRALEEDIFSPFDGPAYEPWETWKSDPLDGPLALVQMAILAASPHNTQPWRFKVLEDRIDLFADLSRHIGTFDPYRREMRIGLGCAIENLSLAAGAHGYHIDINLEGGELTAAPASTGIEHVATISLRKGTVEADPLFAAIPSRHTNRSPYSRDRSLPRQFLADLANMASNSGCRLDVFEHGQGREQFDQLMMDATNTIVADAEMVRDSHRWIRTTDAAIQKFRDGPTLDAVGLPPAITIAAKIFPDPSAQQGHEMWRDGTRDRQLATSPLTGFLSIKSIYGKVDNIVAGRVWQRLHLMATRQNISVQPMNQPIELVDRERQLNKPATASTRLSQLIGSSDWRPTFAFRMGYSEHTPPLSPRRAARDCLA